MNLRDMKMLWGRSANRCAICRCELIADPQVPADKPAVVGDMAHIVARKSNFTRGNYDGMSEEQREAYPNRILVCKNDHKKIDDQPEHFTVEKLHELKTAHEEWVRQQLSDADLIRQWDDEVYAAYVEEFTNLIQIDRWTAHGTWICSPDGPEMTTEYHDMLAKVGSWVISRLWPHRYSDLEDAFLNFRDVLNDLLGVFHRHAESVQDGQLMVTARFYKSREWLEEADYLQRAKRYEEHTALIEDLFFELTRALNYICDSVRKNIIPSFRVREGALLVERGPVGLNMRIEHTRPEYRGDQRASHPYPGLKAFETERYQRDFYVKTNYDW
jgi:hypothetical protein